MVQTNHYNWADLPSGEFKDKAESGHSGHIGPININCSLSDEMRIAVLVGRFGHNTMPG